MPHANARRRRHWRQRFEPGLRFIFRRPCTLGGTRYGTGDPVPDSVGSRLLRKMWNSQRIELSDWTDPPVHVSREAKIDAAVAQVMDGPAEGRTDAGKPRVKAIETILGFDITMADRDAAMERAGG